MDLTKRRRPHLPSAGARLGATLAVLAFLTLTPAALRVGAPAEASAAQPGYSVPQAAAPLLFGRLVEQLGSTSPAAGVVHFEKDAGTSFDGEDQQANEGWIRGHFARMLTYSPFFDSNTRWYPNAWVYKDAYAIYVGSSLAATHPNWILRDASGTPLYIPFGSPPVQYAADISNPEYRQYWIADLKATLAKGYLGVLVDDVNMWANTGDVNDVRVPPISGVTHQTISDESWRGYMVTFMREIRAATLGYEVLHNSVWYADGGTANRATTSPVARQQIEAADTIVVERGVNDAGLTGGSGPWSLSNLLTYVDELHALGKSVLMAGTGVSVAEMEYNLAAYFLVSEGRDFVAGGGDTQTVTSFWSGWSTYLGAASGPRYSWHGLLRRDFEGGSVYLNPPGGQPVVVGARTLPGASGAIVAGAAP